MMLYSVVTEFSRNVDVVRVAEACIELTYPRGVVPSIVGKLMFRVLVDPYPCEKSISPVFPVLLASVTNGLCSAISV